MYSDEDLALALQLQEQFAKEEHENKMVSVSGVNSPSKQFDINNKENHYRKRSSKEGTLIDPTWEYLDPTPDIHALFMQFDKRFFGGRLKGVEVRWSPRMTTCAGVCCYEGRGGLCSVRLSVPLLKLRPRKDLVETLLHEMIHAYLFVTDNNRDRDGHGPEFHKHMYRINKEAGTNITVYHSFHAEVKLYQQHWWRCDGPCQKRPPYFGMVKRAMNRAPGPTDFWWETHKATCGGHYIKVREPEGFSEKKSKKADKKGAVPSNQQRDIRNFFPFNGKGNTLGSSSSSSSSSILNKPVDHNPTSPAFRSTTNNIKGFQDLHKQNGNVAEISKKKPDLPGNKRKAGGSVKGTQNGHPKKPFLGDKSPGSSSSGNKGNAKPGGFGGMLANKGSGTLVITPKGSNKTKTDVQTINGDLNNANTVGGTNKNINGGANVHTFNGSLVSSKSTSNIVPFTGKGHTLGTSNGGGGMSRLLNAKSETVTSKTLKTSHVLSKDSETASFDRLKTSKEHNIDNKQIENISSIDLTISPEKNLSGSSDKFVTCPVCNAKVRELDINTHLDHCIGSDMIDDDPIIIEDSPDRSKGNSDSVNCPACNAEVQQCNLNIHLETCLGGVFGDESVGEDDDWKEEKTLQVKTEENMYPCPCCATLIKDVDMNSHLDLCLSQDILTQIEGEIKGVM